MFTENEEVLQMFESALISKLPNFISSSGFHSFPDNIAQDMISELHI